MVRSGGGEEGDRVKLRVPSLSGYRCAQWRTQNKSYRGSNTY